MTARETRFYGYNVLQESLPSYHGRFIVLEGTDGAGRSSQIALLREWLENKGYAVATSGLKRGQLAGKGLINAMEGHTLGDTTMNLLYATDLADRLEREIIPALRAGFIMLTDRYFYSIVARGLVRGQDQEWLRDLFSFALVPDIVLYMDASVDHLVPRVLNRRGFDYWESGMDYLASRDYHSSFVSYQRQLLDQYDNIADEYNFHRINADRSMYAVFRDLQSELEPIMADMKPPEAPLSSSYESDMTA
jgi:dTMP kinase